MTKLPTRFAGLRAAMGQELPDGHPVIRALHRDECSNQEFLAWLDERYARVFADPRFTISQSRRAELMKQLADPSSFLQADPEVQLAATVLSHPRPTVEFVERSAEGVRTPDLKIALHRELEVEVRIVRESDEDREVDRAERCIISRLKAANLQQGCRIMVRVRRVRDRKRKVLLDAHGQKRLVQETQKIIAAGPPSNRTFVALDTSTDVVVRNREDPRDIASVELQPPTLSTAVIMGFSGLHPPRECCRVKYAIRKKAARKQRSGTKPWVIVLDGSGSTLNDIEEISEGARRYFQTSRNVSGVVFQRWAVIGLGLGQDEQWFVRFDSRLFANTNATLPLTDGEMALFNSSEIRRL
jgi:hypothetical protein